MRIAQQLHPTGAPPSGRLADQTSSAGVGSCERPHDAFCPERGGTLSRWKVNASAAAASGLSYGFRVTVRRVSGPWSEPVHDLLSCVADAGFEAAPLAHGWDERDGRSSDPRTSATPRG